MINDNSDEIEFILWDEEDDENNSSWSYGRIRFDRRLWFFPEVLSFSPSSNYRHPRRQSNIGFFNRQQSNYNFPYQSLETKREIAGLENLPWLEHLPAEIMDYCQDSINLLIGSYYFSNFWEVLADNETKTFPVKAAKYFLSPISVASNLTRYVVLENGNTTRIDRAKEVGKELGVIFFASLVIGPMYREDSPYLEGIKQLENFLVTTWPESVAAISESQIKVESLIIRLFGTKDAEGAKKVKDLIYKYGSEAAIKAILTKPSRGLSIQILQDSDVLDDKGRIFIFDNFAYPTPGKLLIKAGGIYGQLAGNYTLLMELQEENQRKRNENKLLQSLLNFTKNQKERWHNFTNNKNDLKRNLLLSIGNDKDQLEEFLPPFKDSFSESPIKDSKPYEQLFQFISDIKVVSSKHVIISFGKNRSVFIPKATIWYFKHILPYRQVEGLQDLLQIYEESRKLNQVLEKVTLLGLGLIEGKDQYILFKLLTTIELYIVNKVIKISDLSPTTKKLIFCLVNYYYLRFRKPENFIILNKRTVFQTLQSILKFEIYEMNRFVISNLTSVNNLDKILSQKVYNIQESIPGYREKIIFKKIFPSKQDRSFILQNYKWSNLKKFISTCNKQVINNSTVSTDKINFSIRKKIQIVILSKFEKAIPVILFIAGWGTIFMIEIITSEVGDIYLSPYHLLKRCNHENNPIFLVAKLTIADKISKLPELGKQIFLCDKSQIDTIIEISTADFEISVLPEKIESCQLNIIDSVKPKIKIILNKLKTK